MIAEGVENAEQIGFMCGQGCHGLHGFFVTEPLTAHAAPGPLEQHLKLVPDGISVDLHAIRARYRLSGAI